MDLLFGVLLGGGVLLLLNKQQSAPPAPKPPAPTPLPGTGGICAAVATLGKSTVGLTEGQCQDILDAFGTVIDTVQSLNDESQQALDRTRQYAAENDTLNGEIEIPTSSGVNDVTRGGFPVFAGNAIRYKNGCVPYASASGWDKCAQGTHDMSAGALDARAVPENLRAKPAFATTAEASAYQGDGDEYYPGTVQAHYGNLLTASPDPKEPDPATTGPFKDATGALYWFVKGQKMTCPEGQAPGLWDQNGMPISDQRSGLPSCVPGGRGGYTVTDAGPADSSANVIDATGDTTCNADGTAPSGMTWVCGDWTRLAVGQTALNAPDGRVAPSGYTWDASKCGWRTLPAGETQNPGPCQPTPTTTTKTGDVSTKLASSGTYYESTLRTRG